VGIFFEEKKSFFKKRFSSPEYARKIGKFLISVVFGTEKLS